MELTKKEKQIKYAVYCAVLLVCSLLQNVGGLFLQIGNARCFLLISVALLLTIDEDEKVAAFLGLFAGALWDTTSAQHMGFNAVFLMVVCFACSCLVTYAFRATFKFSMVCVVVAVFAYCLLHWLFFIAFAKVESGASTLLYFYIPCFIYSGVVAPVIYKILMPLKNKLNKAYEIQQ